MSSQPPGSAGTKPDVPAWERGLLTLFFGGLIVVAFAYQAVEAAASFGWIAYPVVAVTAAASFLIARFGWRALTAGAQAHVRRQQRIEEAKSD